MSVKIGSEIKFVGETFKLEAVEKWSDLTEYYAYSFHDGKIVKTYVGSNFSMGDDCALCDVEVDVTPEVKAKLEAFERREERTKKARARREYNQYAWREAKKLKLHRSEWQVLNDMIGYKLSHVLEMLVKLESEGRVTQLSYRDVTIELLTALETRDFAKLKTMESSSDVDYALWRIQTEATKLIYGDY